MGLVSRVAAAAVAVCGTSLVVACGGSVADADRDPAGSGATRSSAPATPFCVAARANSDALRPLNALSTGGSRPDSLSNTVDAVRRTGAELLRVAPDEIRPDVERTVQAVNLQLDALVANGGDVGAIASDPELVARLSSPDLAGAGERYRTYVNRTCTASTAPSGSG
jgi:hypothetical protein